MLSINYIETCINQCTRGCYCLAPTNHRYHAWSAIAAQSLSRLVRLMNMGKMNDEEIGLISKVLRWFNVSISRTHLILF